ncbi:predicted protein [Scheffersomyces stipitis CBS 6054]|uniref:Pre-mRNA-splicing factor CWC25 n=1 Tax=Scheffersomyces stipitis (strain ATCC 58785 / CBS 6054 / NBRC 10063 / NRRL Y-11545) TaxID=322104 RepID=A3LVH3_PICST|nr:predicted protein [Scheffersomyces stipitis CBS 6054]ABN66778.2 predicted protein [Scheffersomyces stipitis CBS 6054]
MILNIDMVISFQFLDMAGDLNLKKSWNPALVKNQKKVWEEEQNKLKELKRIKELNQEFQKEQEYRNLLKLQYGEDFNEGDLKKNEKLKLSKLNWMYDDMPKTDEPTENSSGFTESNEEFLEGKTKVENLLNGNKAFNRNKPSDNINRIINVGKTVSSDNKVAQEDPLLSIRSQQQRIIRNQQEKMIHSHRSRESSRNDGDRRERERSDKERKEYRSERSNRERSSRERSDRERSDRERSDRERSDRERSDRERSDRERSNRDKDRSHRSSHHRHHHHRSRDRSPSSRHDSDRRDHSPLRSNRSIDEARVESK